MLILNRKPGQRILIGSDIQIDVRAVTPSNVQLGFHTPTDVPVFRAENYREPYLGHGQKYPQEVQAIITAISRLKSLKVGPTILGILEDCLSDLEYDYIC